MPIRIALANPAQGRTASTPAATRVATTNCVRWFRYRSATEPPSGPPKTLGKTNIIPTTPASRIDQSRTASPNGTMN